MRFLFDMRKTRIIRIIETEKFKIFEYFLPGRTSSGAKINRMAERKGVNEKRKIKIMFSFKVSPQRLIKYSSIKLNILPLTAGTNFIVPALG